MKHFLLSFILLLVLGIFIFPKTVSAQAAKQSGNTNITVTVAGNSLSLSGYIAPYASIVLTVNGNVITSTTADNLGNFAFSNVAVPKATSTVCLTAVDFKKLGESEACINVTPVNGVITKTGIFLPPTMGVQRTEVLVGNNALAFGYGMPGATVTVHVNNTVGCTVAADASGYYQCTIVIQKAGDYVLFADAVLNHKPSEQQLKKILIKGVTEIKATPFPTVGQIGVPSLPGFNLFAIPWWVWLLLVLITIILIIILLRRYWPKGIPLPKVAVPGIKIEHAFDWLFKSKKLHHWWMDGVGY